MEYWWNNYVELIIIKLNINIINLPPIQLDIREHHQPQ